MGDRWCLWDRRLVGGGWWWWWRSRSMGCIVLVGGLHFRCVNIIRSKCAPANGVWQRPRSTGRFLLLSEENPGHVHSHSRDTSVVLRPSFQRVATTARLLRAAGRRRRRSAAGHAADPKLPVATPGRTRASLSSRRPTNCVLRPRIQKNSGLTQFISDIST
jgi:hypothetical protein